MQKLIINITQENFKPLEDNDLGCFILTRELSESFKQRFITQAHKIGKLCLFSGQEPIEEYLKFGADGVILDLSKEEKPQRIIKEFKQKNPKAVLGVISRNRRHEAMLISECEPEFVIFKIWADGIDKTKELLDWFNEFFLIQSAILPVDASLEIEKLAVDFIIKNDKDI